MIYQEIGSEITFQITDWTYGQSVGRKVDTVDVAKFVANALKTGT